MQLLILLSYSSALLVLWVSVRGRVMELELARGRIHFDSDALCQQRVVLENLLWLEALDEALVFQIPLTQIADTHQSKLTTQWVLKIGCAIG
jgi:hypothetical protein